MLAVFAGFPRESIEFFKQLAANNNRDWFRAHKEVYERACRAPMQALVAELQPKFGKAKISRINRDVRFSRSRAPYKAYVAAGLGGHYISVSAEGLYVGAGFRRPNPVFLRRLRAAIDDSTAGRRLDAILRSLRLKGYEVSSHETLSSTPRGYAPDHPRIELLQIKDIAAGRLFGPVAVEPERLWTHLRRYGRQGGAGQLARTVRDASARKGKHRNGQAQTPDRACIGNSR